MKSEQQKADSRGHVLVSLWDEYYNFQKQDRPKSMSEAAKKITEKATSGRLPWDFYEGWNCYVDAEVSRNWKERSNMRSQRDAAVDAFDEPIVTYQHRIHNSQYVKDIEEWIGKEEGRLKKTRNNQFYKYCNTSSQLGGVLAEKIENDYEYTLWSNVSRRHGDNGLKDNFAFNKLWNMLEGTYPKGAYLEFLDADSYPDSTRRAKLQEVASKYKGKAIGLYAEDRLVGIKKNDLDKAKAGSDEYKALLKECQDLESRRKAMKGEEGRMVKELGRAKSLIENLNSQHIRVYTKDNDIVVILKNLPSANVTVKQRDDNNKYNAILSKTLDNPKRSFYVPDTVSMAMPVMDDGAYEIIAENGKNKSKYSTYRTTISLAVRDDAEGHKAYAADCKSGKPIEKASLKLYKNGSLIASVADFKFDKGFTLLPSEITDKMQKNARYELVCCLDEAGKPHRESPRLGLWQYRNNPEKDYNREGKYCNIYTDRGAYNPGDTVYFKGVLYHGDLVNSVQPLKEGEKVTAIFHDSEGKEISNLSLKTNDYGSVAGQFTIPTGLRNGHFSIELKAEGYEGHCYFVVDEFILPTFTVEFEPSKELYLPGDEVVVKGKVKSYSGHPLSGANVAYKITSRGGHLAEGDISPDEDGNFVISFPSDVESRWGFYNVEVIVTDETGETHEYNTRAIILSYLNIEIEALNSVDAEFSTKKQEYGMEYAFDSKDQKFKIFVRNNDGEAVPMDLNFVVEDEEGKTVKSGTMASGDTLSLNIGGGLYKLIASAAKENPHNGEKYENKESCYFFKVENDVLDAPVDYYMRFPEDTEIESGQNMVAKLGSANGPIWAVAEIFGKNRQLLDRQMVYIEGRRGDKLKEISFEYKDAYPDAVLFQIFYFKNSGSQTFSTQFRRHRHTLDLPLEFSRFEDKTLPSSRYTFSVKTAPSTEALVAIYDKSTETINRAWWSTVSMMQFSVPDVHISRVCGNSEDNDGEVDLVAMGASDVAYRSVGIRMAKSANVLMETEDAMDDAMPEAAMANSMVMAVAEEEIAEAPADVEIRDNFANTLTFQPMLNSGADGETSFDFETSGKLSTYVVRVFAHDKNMRNGIISKEMVVSIPVKVSVAEPKYLYSGDEYSLAVSMASNSDKALSGKLWLYQFDGKDYANLDPVAKEVKDVTIPAGGSTSETFKVSVPEVKEGSKDLGLKVVFATDDGEFSDGVFVPVAIYPASQTLTEAHSAVLLAGMDREALLEGIRSAFVNVSAHGAETKEISIIDMVKEAIPTSVNPSRNDILTLSEAYYVRLVAKSLGVAQVDVEESDDKILERIMACRNADGGFGWFEGMNSSPVLTAVILERFAKLRGLGGVDLTSSVKYLDKTFFDLDRPYWCGGISTSQYLYVRSLYPTVDWDTKDYGSGREFQKRMKDFKKFVNEYLVPADERGLNGAIFAKTRRLKTLMNLTESAEGVTMAKKWGMTLNAGKKMRASLEADVVSLLEYAVDHRDGGIYYPNLVMPYRGLLESEAYAHSMLCDLLTEYAYRHEVRGYDTGGSGAVVGSAVGSFADSPHEALRIADGIRIWLMLQKETQKWEEEPAYVDALHSVLTGPEEVKQTKVILMKKTYEKPFEEILAAGNGFKVERHFYRETTFTDKDTGKEKVTEEEIAPGTMLHVGDKITARYEIWNAENRSYVRLSAPREAALRPSQQLSGMYGWGIRPLRVNGWWSFQPHGYRNVKSAVTEYYFDSYPEENTTITEEFFVTQEGTFTAPVLEIESLYAPHYRANAPFSGPLTAAKE